MQRFTFDLRIPTTIRVAADDEAMARTKARAIAGQLELDHARGTVLDLDLEEVLRLIDDARPHRERREDRSG